ncbi:MAG: hypothetical protein JW808_06980 [Victivallales bacterium]|nr:hypothetical protein [Victivallales bacterium]
MILEKYSMGVGDRFGRQGVAQLGAFVKAAQGGINVVPVWNKSYREHSTIGTSPPEVRAAADNAVNKLGWQGAYFVDADHVGRKNVELFIESSDFFTLDVADFTGRRADDCDIRKFTEKHAGRVGELKLPGMDRALLITDETIREAACKYLLAVKEAACIYRMIEDVKGAGNFVTEVSMDETDLPQTPLELFFILAAVADCGIPAQTIAPKFSGRFNKGVDYVGDVANFAREFSDDVAVIAYAVEEFGLPGNLKLSVHSGSDKFSIYPAIKKVLEDYDAGLHLKTAGTTWLEELAGLAEADGEGLDAAKNIYSEALGHFEELCAPYSTVIDISPERLPASAEVSSWTAEEFAAALSHDPSCDLFNPDFRQLMHVAYKIAAGMGTRYISLLDKFQEIISANVEENIFERHIRRIFPASR